MVNGVGLEDLFLSDPGRVSLLIELMDKAAPVAEVTGTPLLLHLDQEGIPVTVREELKDLLGVSRSLSLNPIFLSGAGIENRSFFFKGPFESPGIHIAHHQNLTRVVILDNSGDQTVFIKFKLRH